MPDATATDCASPTPPAQDRNDAGLPLRPLGRTGLEVSIIGLGGGHMARPAVSEQDSIRLVQTAVDEGVTFFDNAWEYWGGESERRMGLALSAGGRRDRIVLMTKCCGRDRRTAEVHLDESLRRLQTDRIDVWQFHEMNYDNDPDWIFAAGGAIEAALAAKQAGKVRFIGFTGHKSPHILLKLLARDFEWDTCQLPVNVMDAHYRSFQNEVLPELVRRGIAPLGMKSLGGEAQLVTQAGLTPRECRRFALSLPISTLICGMQTLDDLRQDLAIARDFTPLPDAERDELLARVRPQAGDGRYEWFKSTQYFDSPLHREQHGFPPIGHVSQRGPEPKPMSPA
ncbi:MAG TPA: aldo/keto reductase [Planctomycetaceae bacterium]|nr:aldo/keto reductase [Planctomycetaceae bacterium]